jgi:hypothetical protein
MDQPAYVQNLVYDSGWQVVLSWDPSPEGDVVKYAVYCDTTAGFKPSADNFLSFVNAPDTSLNVGAPGDTAYYVVNAIDTSGYAGGYSNEVCASPATSIAGPVTFADRLYQNVPNPFNPTTTIRFELASAANVQLTVYDVRGHNIRTLLDGYHTAGLHISIWDGLSDTGEQVSSGVYFYKLKTAGFVKTRKMVLLK